MKVIDLFSGCGGLSLGFINAGFDVVKAVEFDARIADSYMKNHPTVPMIVDDIKNVDQGNVFKKGDAEVIIGGPPCQGFSMAGSRIRHGFIDDPRNYLFKHYFNVVKTVKPKAFIMENVKGIQTMQGGAIFREIIDIFSDPELLDGMPYNLSYKIVKASDYGVPQNRERMILFGTTIQNIDFEKEWEKTISAIREESPYFFDNVTVRDAISNLGPTTESGIITNPIPETHYQKSLATNNSTITNHNKTNHSTTAINRMKKIDSGENYTVLDETIHSVHSGSYGRLEWDKPSPTITTRFDTPAGGRFIHPEEDRTITPREAARLQSFPDSFVFYGNKTTVCKQIGNAVPPKLSFFLAKFVESCLKDEGANK